MDEAWIFSVHLCYSILGLWCNGRTKCRALRKSHIQSWSSEIYDVWRRIRVPVVGVSSPDHSSQVHLRIFIAHSQYRLLVIISVDIPYCLTWPRIIPSTRALQATSIHTCCTGITHSGIEGRCTWFEGSFISKSCNWGTPMNMTNKRACYHWGSTYLFLWTLSIHNTILIPGIMGILRGESF